MVDSNCGNFKGIIKQDSCSVTPKIAFFKGIVRPKMALFKGIVKGIVDSKGGMSVHDHIC